MLVQSALLQSKIGNLKSKMVLAPSLGKFIFDLSCPLVNWAIAKVLQSKAFAIAFRSEFIF